MSACFFFFCLPTTTASAVSSISESTGSGAGAGGGDGRDPPGGGGPRVEAARPRPAPRDPPRPPLPCAPRRSSSETEQAEPLGDSESSSPVVGAAESCRLAAEPALRALDWAQWPARDHAWTAGRDLSDHPDGIGRSDGIPLLADTVLLLGKMEVDQAAYINGLKAHPYGCI